MYIIIYFFFILIDEKWVYCGFGDKWSFYFEIVFYNFCIKY